MLPSPSSPAPTPASAGRPPSTSPTRATPSTAPCGRRSRTDKLLAMAEQAGVEVHLAELDVAEDDSVREGFARILAETGGRVDTLVNNAGIGGNAVAEEATPELYLDVMNVNLCGAVRCLQAVLPGMRERRQRRDRQHHVDRRADGGHRPVAVRGVEVRLRGAQRGPRPGAGAVRHPRRDHRARASRSRRSSPRASTPRTPPAPTTRPYRRMFQFYATGIANATDPFEVAEVIHHAITTDTPQLRYAMSWGGTRARRGPRRARRRRLGRPRRDRGRRRVLRPLRRATSASTSAPR